MKVVTRGKFVCCPKCGTRATVTEVGMDRFICKNKDCNARLDVYKRQSLISIVMVCAFLVIVFGAFSSINDKWSMRQAARETLLIMETEGYLKPEDEQALIHELEGYGLYNISLSGTTTSEVDYGERIYLKITGTYGSAHTTLMF